MVERNRGLLGLIAIGNQSAQNVDSSIDWRAMARMLDLRNVLQLVDDGLNDGTLAEHQTVIPLLLL